MSARLPEPPLDGEDPYADFVDYLQRLIRVSVEDRHTQAPIAFMAVLSYAIVVSVVYFFWHWRTQRKEHKPLWVAKLIRTPQGRYITLNQAVVTTLTNLLVSLLWLCWAVYLHLLWFPQTNFHGRWLVYFINVSLIVAFIPLYLITFLLISAGNLTSRRRSRAATTTAGEEGRAGESHYLPPWATNSLLLILFPSLFLLMFVPSLLAGASYARYINLAASIQRRVRGLQGPVGESEKGEVGREILRLTYEVLNPVRATAFVLQRKARICQVVPFGVLLLINLLGFVFLLRHLRQDHRTGHLVFHGTSVVAPLASHITAAATAPSPSPSSASPTSTSTTQVSPTTSGGRDEEKAIAAGGGGGSGFGRTLTRSLTFTRAGDGGVGGSGDEGREDYERGPAVMRQNDEGAAVARAPWEITTTYFCVPLICLLVVGFFSWVISIYGYSSAFNTVTAVEIASLSVPLSYTLVNLTVTSALVFKKSLAAWRGDEQKRPPRWQENPFGQRTNRRVEGGGGAGEEEGEEERGEREEDVDKRVAAQEEVREKRLRDFQQRRRSSLGVASSFRPSLGGRKVSVVSLASSVGSVFTGASGAGGGGQRRGSGEKEKEKEKEKGREAVVVVTAKEREKEADVDALRGGRNEPQSLMAGVEKVVQREKEQDER